MRSENGEHWFQREGSAVDSFSFDKDSWELEKPVSKLVKELFALPYLGAPRKDAPPTDEIESYLSEKVADVGVILTQLKGEAAARAEVHDETVREIDYQITKAATSLDQFSRWGIGYNTGVDFKRNSLERDLSNLRKERRSTILKTWTDLRILRAEFREALAQYRSLLSRHGLL